MTQQNPEWKESRDESMWEAEQKRGRRSFTQKAKKETGRSVNIVLMILYTVLAAVFIFVLYCIYDNAVKLAAALDAPEGSSLHGDVTWYIWTVIFWTLWACWLVWKTIRLMKKNRRREQ